MKNVAFDLLGGNTRHIALGDKVTKKQKIAIKHSPFRDSDRDGVIDGLDCQPKNKRKHSMYREDYYQQNDRLRNSYKFFPKNPTQQYISLKALEAQRMAYREAKQ
jgi:hypothetical protein